MRLAPLLTAPLRSTPGNRRRNPSLSSEALAAAVAVVLSLGYNVPFWRIALGGREAWAPDTWIFAAGTFVLLATLHFVPLMLLGISWALRPLLAASFLAAAAAQYFSLRYGVLIDTDMIRNALHTNAAESSEYLGWGLAIWMLLLGLLPAALMFRLRTRPLRWPRALLRRTAAVSAACLLALAAGRIVYQDLASVARNQSALKYAVNPLAPLWYTGRALWRETHQSTLAHAAPEPAWRESPTDGESRKPLLLVLVVGETARAANFSLLGYPRLTNPELAREDVIPFSHVNACGTATEVSLPCMFSPYGRADYDETQIRTHDSLLQVLAHAGFAIAWLDNQSGCKRVCDGFPYEEVQRSAAPGACTDGECYDEVLLPALRRVASTGTRDQVVVLHQLGNHGPAYHRRYPPAFARFRPACNSDELRDCSREEIANAYDNAILYTDHVLAEVVRSLRALQSTRDVAMIYVSDHGESLGEHGLYLHGTPYVLAPQEQLQVPMIWWTPAPAARDFRVDADCLRRHAGDAVSHDNLYHTVLGLLRVHARTYRPERDLSRVCRLSFAGRSATPPGADAPRSDQSRRHM